MILSLTLFLIIVILTGLIFRPIEYIYFICSILSVINTAVNFFIIGSFVFFIVTRLLYTNCYRIRSLIDYYISVLLDVYFLRGNAKDIGTLYLIFALFSGLLGTAFSVLIRLELSEPTLQYVVDNQLYNNLVAAHAIFMILFMVVPALIGGFGNFFLFLLKANYPSHNEMDYFFFIVEAIIVLGPISYYIRYPISNFIHSIESLNVISALILKVYFNITLGTVNFYLFKFIRIYLFPTFIPIFSCVVIYLILPLRLDFGFYYVTRRKLTKFRQGRIWVKAGERYLKMSRECARQSRILNAIAPLMDRSGRGGLYDSFTECARSLKNKAEGFENNAAFLWVNSVDMIEHTSLISATHSDLLIEFTGYPQDHATRQWSRGFGR